MKPLNDAQRALVEQNRGLVYHLLSGECRWAAQVYGSFEDAAQEGALGLMQAAVSFRAERGVAFSTCACRCVRQRYARARTSFFKANIRSVDDHAKAEALPAPENVEALALCRDELAHLWADAADAGLRYALNALKRRELEGVTNAELCHESGLSLPALRYQLERARAFVRERNAQHLTAPDTSARP